jgi:hypothetical protein
MADVFIRLETALAARYHFIRVHWKTLTYAERLPQAAKAAARLREAFYNFDASLHWESFGA